MLIFYAWQKIGNNASEADIWNILYHNADWQMFFDVFNSFPLAAMGLGIAIVWKYPRVTAFFGGILLHIAGDFPFHQADAHRHFYPFSDWRFISPISYWDPNSMGHIVSAIEAAAVCIGFVIVFKRFKSFTPRIVLSAVVGTHILYWAFAFYAWM